jgi:hypothetical protein
MIEALSPPTKSTETADILRGSCPRVALVPYFASCMTEDIHVVRHECRPMPYFSDPETDPNSPPTRPCFAGPTSESARQTRSRT